MGVCYAQPVFLIAVGLLGGYMYWLCTKSIVKLVNAIKYST